MTERQKVAKSVLKTLVPANALNPENFSDLADKAYLEKVTAGTTLFKKGDVDRRAVYLLRGEIALISDDGKRSKLVAGTDASKHPIANQQPRQVTAEALTQCEVTRFDSDLLDLLLTWDQLSGIEVSEIQVEDKAGDESDWMTRILQSQAFLQIPPANIQAMFMRMQEVPVRAGEVIINQGDDGDYYYIIKSGTAKVTRSAKTGSEIVLAHLKDGDAFGEEALISETKRNANIAMESDGVLMRLSKDDFNELLKEPMLNWVSADDADERVKAGAKWLDVRLESEYENTGKVDSINIPLFMLRLKADSLDSATPYVIYCDTGRRSSAAAFLLNERGFETYVLSGGVMEQKSA